MIREVAQIDEERCIGCARCLPPCPFDAILGAKKQMHTVLVELCTGCELCLPACPVDCIEMVPRGATSVAPGAHVNRERVLAHNARVARRAAEQAATLTAKKQTAHVS
jgi:Na+-translocating ferredoxin:NAD+ oxidoreductase subunit B